MNRNSMLFGVVLIFAGAVAALAGGLTAPRNLVGQTNYHLQEFEKEVSRQRGGEKAVWRNKRDALERVQKLKIDYPDDPEVEKLYQRARIALMKSMGKYTVVDPEWTLYKRNEETLRKVISAESQKLWNKTLEEHAADVLPKLFPAPDPNTVPLDDLEGKYVVMTDVRYPDRQFYGATGEYVWCGKPSEGYYFIDIAGREWLGPYEAIKRYRRNVDSSLLEVKSWTMLGQITGITAEIPQAGEEKIGSFRYGWVVTPVMLMVPDHVAGLYDAEAPSSGRYAGEDKVPELKEAWYTVKSIPQDVTPERLMEIFMTAIKEKNYKLYLDCINPERQGSDVGDDLVRYHWDLHQERFAREYVHATFDKAVISVIKGFDTESDLNNFFLDDEQKEFLTRAKGIKVEQAIVESRAVNEHGQQVGSPHPHKLIRRGGGRWYVEDYMPRF